MYIYVYRNRLSSVYLHYVYDFSLQIVTKYMYVCIHENVK